MSPVRPGLSALLCHVFRQRADKRKVATRASRDTIFKLTMVAAVCLVQVLGHRVDGVRCLHTSTDMTNFFKDTTNIPKCPLGLFGCPGCRSRRFHPGRGQTLLARARAPHPRHVPGNTVARGLLYTRSLGSKNCC